MKVESSVGGLTVHPQLVYFVLIVGPLVAKILPIQPGAHQQLLVHLDSLFLGAAFDLSLLFLKFLRVGLRFPVLQILVVFLQLFH